MRLIQITPTLSQNDAIFNEVCAVSEIFESDGIKCVVYAENIAKSALSSDLEIRKIETLSATAALSESGWGQVCHVFPPFRE